MKAQELALFRKEQGLSLTSLGRLLKMRSSTLSDYERGKYPIPEEKAIYKSFPILNNLGKNQ